MTHVVVFDQGNKECPFFIDPISRHREMRSLMQNLSYKWVYTDIFTGSQEQCEEFIDNHKLRR